MPFTQSRRDFRITIDGTTPPPLFSPSLPCAPPLTPLARDFVYKSFYRFTGPLFFLSVEFMKLRRGLTPLLRAFPDFTDEAFFLIQPRCPPL